MRDPRTTAPQRVVDVVSRLASVRRSSNQDPELLSALAGDHGPGVQADVLAAIQRWEAAA